MFIKSKYRYYSNEEKNSTAGEKQGVNVVGNNVIQDSNFDPTFAEYDENNIQTSPEPLKCIPVDSVLRQDDTDQEINSFSDENELQDIEELVEESDCEGSTLDESAESEQENEEAFFEGDNNMV